MKFTKWHGAGNDFIITTREALIEAGITDLSALAAAICHRRFGIGADGLMVADTSALADVKMTYYNSDGSYAAMCGNGIRCFSAFCHHIGLLTQSEFSVETGDGIKTITFVTTSPYQVEVDMGVAVLNLEQVPCTLRPRDSGLIHLEMDQAHYALDVLKVGVPHTVVDLEASGDKSPNFSLVGPQIENHPGFPERTNVNFVRKTGDSSLRVDTWERGAGLTYACGTGVCASAFSYWRRGKVTLPVTVEVTGGVLSITLRDNHIMMTGPAAFIAEGNWS